jgi:NFU1 iron-sulfur cluster scaffold homolog, mitochondrial
MYIQTENTPNPNTMKFLPGETVLQTGTATFKSKDDAQGVSTLASVLFEIPDVEMIFFGSDFITVTKKDTADWTMLKANVLTTVMEHYISGRPAMDSEKKSFNKADTSNAEDSELVKQIKELIDTRVRPAVAEDGGDIIFQGFTDGVVYLELHGSCSGCPSSTITLKNGIENMLKHYVPEVIAVEAVNGE